MAADETRKTLAIRITAATLGASAGLASPEFAVAGAGLTPILDDALGHIFEWVDSHRRENAAETLTDAADEFGAETPEQFIKFIEDAVSDPERSSSSSTTRTGTTSRTGLRGSMSASSCQFKSVKYTPSTNADVSGTTISPGRSMTAAAPSVHRPSR